MVAKKTVTDIRPNAKGSLVFDKSQVSQDTLNRMADILEAGNYSLYQKTNAAFAITTIIQLISLLYSIFVILVKPLTIKVSVHWLHAIIVNSLVLFFSLFIFLYAILSVLDVIKTIFRSGQVVNFIFVKNKVNNENKNE